MKELTKVVNEIGQLLVEQGLFLTTAESCTGGQVAQVLTGVSGSSRWFDQGFVTYSNKAKEKTLGVYPSTLEKHGAVSEKTVCEMAEGALKNSDANMSVATTGIAGPDGGSQDNPVGTVWIGWARENKQTEAKSFFFKGDRSTIREQAVEKALHGLLKVVSS